MLVSQLWDEIEDSDHELLVMVRHKAKLYTVALLEDDDCGNLILVIQDTPDATEEKEEAIDPDLDDNQSQDEEDTPCEESEDTKLEEILEELEGSTSPDIHSSHDHNSAITRILATEYRINPQEAV